MADPLRRRTALGRPHETKTQIIIIIIITTTCTTTYRITQDTTHDVDRDLGVPVLQEEGKAKPQREGNEKKS